MTVHGSPAAANEVTSPKRETPLLDVITSPTDLKQLPLAQLPELANEIRQELIDVVTRTGGHLGASLGAVELAIALHWVFDSPQDRIVWDVGHQAYAHKLLTGRRDRFSTIRQEGGLSGFLSRDESEHDAFGAGHASTSISAALGMAVAFSQSARTGSARGRGHRRWRPDRRHGLRGAQQRRLPRPAVHRRPQRQRNVDRPECRRDLAAISTVCAPIRATTAPRTSSPASIERFPQGDLLVELGKRWKDSVKEFIYHAMIWEELGFTYIGPVDGHDISDLIDAIPPGLQVPGPVFLHVLTEKGEALLRPHRIANAVTPFPPQSALGRAARHRRNTRTSSPRPSSSWRRTIPASWPSPPRCRPAPRWPSSRRSIPTASSTSASPNSTPSPLPPVWRAQGMRPVVGIYSTFLQRAYDQIIHDVCLQHLPVTFAIDRAGFAGDDGRTHHGIFDLSYLRCLPNMIVMAPKDENELRHMLYTALREIDGPVAIRYPRGAGVGAPMIDPLHALPVGRGEILRSGDDVGLLALGTMVLAAERAADLLLAEGIRATVVNARFVKPLDERLILDVARTCPAIVTVEENVRAGGFGSAVLEFLTDQGNFGAGRGPRGAGSCLRAGLPGTVARVGRSDGRPYCRGGPSSPER